MKSNQDNKPAIIYQSLYLSNLLLIPLGSVLVLLYYLYQARPHRASPKILTNFNRIHLYRSIQISVLAGIMLGVAPIFYILYSAEFDVSVMITVFYFVTLHACFVLIGMLNLARAMAKKLPVF
ncbi:hypothetical protein [Colwellia sp. KU-HH00111]|uniref:hypothetical protein n=1 Tax=Colwellia sp. KU-HH00111 TaxID=3127652 RepID=UPI00336571E8